MSTEHLTKPSAWLKAERSEAGRGTSAAAIGARLADEIGQDLADRQDLDGVDRLASLAWLADRVVGEADRVAREALASGATYQAVADALGITRQAAHKRYHG